jgi:signal transduction histidine kinase/ligand-binding sensor domain-containing protein
MLTMCRRVGMLASILLACCASAFASAPSLDISQYAHTAWRVRDGFFKSGINGIAQTPDGYLWLGTEVGLLRFDGVRSVPWQPPPGVRLPSSIIWSLLAARDGTLWIGTFQGLASWKDGKLTQYPELAGMGVTSLLADAAGTVWVGAQGTSTGRLCAIQGGRVRCSGEDGSLRPPIWSLLEDKQGDLWAGVRGGIWRWKPGPPKFHPMPDTVQALIESNNGSLLIATPAGLKQLVDGKIRPYPLDAAGRRQFKTNYLLRAGDGELWIGTEGQGLLHVHDGRTDVFSQSDGLSGDFILRLFEDREGSVWVATANGLDRFHRFAVPTLSVKQGLSSPDVLSVLAARDRSIWLGTTDGLNRWNNGQITIYRRRSSEAASDEAKEKQEPAVREVGGTGLPDEATGSLFEDHRGRIWISTPRGIAYFENGRFTTVSAVPAAAVYSFAGDRAENLWIGQAQGLLHLREESVVERIPWDKLGHKDFAWTLLSDPSEGGVWLGFREGGVAYFKDGQVRASYATGNGLGEGVVNDLLLDGDDTLWAATEGGLSRMKNGHVATLTSRNGLPCDTVNWVMDDDTGSFWLYMACGLVRIARPELDAWAADSNRTIRTTVLDGSDGVRSHPYTTSLHPLVARGADGRLWFLPFDGVSVLDPHHLALNKLPPPVHIEQVTADDKTYDATNGLRLPPHVRYLTIDYTALSLVAPEKVRFRYKLEGEDKDWREVVNDRKVQYTKLAPKHYRFRLIACNNSGVWNEQGAALDFVIPPAWYQTNWFRGACVAAFLGMIWGIHELRVRQLEAQFNMRLEERVAERTRIARDLHDTLLQSFQALLIRFQAGINMLAQRPADARRVLDDAVDRASQAIAEGRDAIGGLRMSTVEKNDLAVSIRTIAEELARAQNNQASTPFQVLVEGTSRELHPILRDEVYRLVTEALRNCFRHAAAENVEVEIRYEEKYFRVRVRDDGKGIPSDVLRGDGREGHYGLHGMRERAKLVGGKLTIWTELNSGTEIELLMPGARAYVKSTRPFWCFGKRSATETDKKETIERE